MPKEFVHQLPDAIMVEIVVVVVIVIQPLLPRWIELHKDCKDESFRKLCQAAENKIWSTCNVVYICCQSYWQTVRLQSRAFPQDTGNKLSGISFGKLALAVKAALTIAKKTKCLQSRDQREPEFFKEKKDE